MNPAEENVNKVPVAKRPYVKPEVRHEKVFETMALACNGTGAKAAGPCTKISS